MNTRWLQFVTTSFESSSAEDLSYGLKPKLMTTHESIIMTKHPNNPFPG